MSFLLASFKKKKELPKLWKVKEYILAAFNYWRKRQDQLLVLFGENDNDLKVTHFSPVTHYAPGDHIIRTCWFKHSSNRSATFVRPYATIMNMWTVRLKYVKIKNKIRVWEARPFLKNYIILNKICISLSMCQENDYNRVVLRNY